MKKHGMPSLSPIRRGLLASLVAGLLACSQAAHGTIVLYSPVPSRNDRFYVGADKTFDGAFPYNWSGVGRNARWGTMISPSYMVSAAHWAPSGAITFYATNDAGGPSETRQVVSSVQITADGNPTDLWLAKLDTPVSANVVSYPIYKPAHDNKSGIANLNSEYNNQIIYTFGLSAPQGSEGPTTVRVGRNTVDSTSYYQYLTVGASTGWTFRYTYDSPPPSPSPLDPNPGDESLLQGGDSGGPSFMVVNGAPALVGIHWAVGSPVSYDTFVAKYITQLGTAMSATGELPTVVMPVTAQWSGASSGDWSSSANWNAGGVSNNVSSLTLPIWAYVQFDGAGTSRYSVNLDVARSVAGLAFTSAAGTGPFTLGGSGTLTIGEAGLTNLSPRMQTISCPVVLSAPQRWNVGPGGLSVSNTISTGSGYLLLVEGAGNTNLSGAISGTGGLAKYGVGALTLSSPGGNSFSGTSFLEGGTLAISRDDHLGVAPASLVADRLTINGGTLAATANVSLSANRGITLGSLGGTLQADGGKTLTTAAPITGAGSLLIAGPGTVSLTSSAGNSYSGTTTISGGTLGISRDDHLGPTPGTLTAARLTINGGVLRALDNVSLSANRGITLGSLGGTLQADGGKALTAAAPITGTGSLLIAGPGTVSLTSGTGNSYAGTTTINGAALAISRDDHLGPAPGTLTPNQLTINGGTLRAADNVALNVNRGIALDSLGGTLQGDGGKTLTTAGPISGLGSLMIAGPGTVALTSGGNSFTGTTTINGGTLAISRDDHLGIAPASFVANQLTLNGGTLEAMDTVSLGATRGITLGSLGGTLVVGSGTTLAALAPITGEGSLLVSGPGTVVFGSSGNFYTGTTTISGGTLAISREDHLGLVPVSSIPSQLTLDAGVLRVTDSLALNANRELDLASLGGSLQVDAGKTLSLASGISGTGPLLIAGPGGVSISGGNLYSGATTIRQAAVTLGGSAGSISHSSGYTLDRATLRIDNSAGNLATGTRLAAGATLTFSSSAFQFIAHNSGSTETLSGLNVASGQNTFTLTGGSAGPSIINAGALSRSPGAVLNFTGALDYNNKIVFNNLAGFINQGTFVKTGMYSTYAVYDPLGLVRGMWGGTDDSSYTDTMTSNRHVLLSSAVAPQPSVSPYTLTLFGNGANVPISGGSTITLQKGGILKTNGGSSTISGPGSLTAPTDVEYVFCVDSASDQLLLNAAIGGGSGLTKAGSGTLVLDAANTYSGPTTVAAGTLVVSQLRALPSGASVTIGAGATLVFASDLSGLSEAPGVAISASGLGLVSVVPEPGTLALLATALAAAALALLPRHGILS